MPKLNQEAMTSKGTPSKTAGRNGRRNSESNSSSPGRPESSAPTFEITHTPDRPRRPAKPSEIPPHEELIAWQLRTIRRSGCRGLGRSDREQAILVGESARQRRMENRILKKPHNDQGNCENTDKPRKRSCEPRPPPLSKDRDGVKHAQADTPRPTEEIPEGNSFTLGTSSREYDLSYTYIPEALRLPQSYVSSHYAGEVVDDQAKTNLTLQSSSISFGIGHHNDDEACGESYNGEVSEAQEVDVHRLYRMEAARRGFCIPCKSRTISPGTYYCANCGQDFDCTSWEELDDGAGELLKEPPALSCVALVPPPPLSQRRLATLMPKMQQGSVRDGGQNTRPSANSVGPGKSETTSPIGVSVLFPQSPSSESGKTTETKHGTQAVEASLAEVTATVNSINPASLLREKLVYSGLSPEVDTIPPTHAVRALRSVQQGGEIRRVVEPRRPTAQLVDIGPRRTETPRQGNLREALLSELHGSRSEKEPVKGGKEKRDSMDWELDILALYEK